MDSEQKVKYKDEFEKVREIVNEFDPCGFIHFGAPIDEYDCLTNILLSSVYQNQTREEIKSVILHEIEHHFGFPDLTKMLEPEKTEFYNDIEKLLDKLDQHIRRSPIH